ncbi:MAG: T9SS type A sorting domain-containing protein [Ignavibacteria bacterium]|nr:T9SS type A sorting domain-containing protein [Ignavibacteria bacterium]
MLYQNYPNPFNPKTTIKFSVSKQGLITLKVFDILGNEVKTLVNDLRNAGEHSVVFDGAGIASGIYFYKLVSGEFAETKRMILLK